MVDKRFNWDVFISYPSPERKRAREFYVRIRDRVRCFYDCEVLKPGDRWPPLVAAALEVSRVTAVLVSAASQSAHYQEEECARAIGYARDRGGDRRVVPVYLDGIPDRTDWNLFGLNVLLGIGVPESNGWDGAVRRFMEIFGDAGSRAIQADEHVLREFPQRFVKAYEIPFEIVEAYAQTFTATRAELLLASANAFRLEADAKGTTINPIDVRPIDNVPPLVWWQSVFTEACRHGARMLAALLLTPTRLELGYKVNTMREHLLDSLRNSNSQ